MGRDNSCGQSTRTGSTIDAEFSRREVVKAGAAVAGTTAIASRTTLAATPEGKRGPSAPVTIKRDEFGVPHIYSRGAKDKTPVFYGFGYATAEDRLYQLDLYRRYYHGTVSEVLGADWVDFDKEARRTTAPGASLAEQLDSQISDGQRAVIENFADGINHYIAETRESDDRAFHRGYHENDFEPEPFDAVDVAGMYVASMAFFSTR